MYKTEYPESPFIVLEMLPLALASKACQSNSATSKLTESMRRTRHAASVNGPFQQTNTGNSQDPTQPITSKTGE